jgi:5'(3')-deoxyribonucleotidase
MNTKPIIAIDIDDVLAANAAGFVEWSNSKFGTHLTPNDYQEHWAEMWKIERAEAEKRAHEFHESDHVSTYKVIPNALEALERLKTRFTLILITSRRLSIEKLTREWIDKNYPDIFSDYIFCGFYDTRGASGLKLTKAELAKGIKADYLIDDQLKHIEAAAQVGIKGLLFGDYSWNKKDQLSANVTRVKDWSEILRYFNLN